MHVDAASSAGLEPADAGRDDHHPIRTWRSCVGDAEITLQEALRVLEYSTRQEVEAARGIICEALGHLAEARETR